MSGSADTGNEVTRAPDRPMALEDLLGAGDRSVASGMRDLLAGLLDVSDRDAGISNVERIKKGVHRLLLESGRATRSVIIKRLDPNVGHRNEVVVTRWLPAVGLGHGGPTHLGTVAERRGKRVWHVYEDMGDETLDAEHPDTSHVEQSVRLVASLHTRFAGHPLLGECRLWGGDLGMTFYESNAVDAIRALEALRPPTVELAPEHGSARDALLWTLRRMLDDVERRRSLLAEHGGPETLLHGDLWRQNVLLVRSDDGAVRPRLIDWDHAAVGHVGYDLSTLLSRFAASERPGVLELYRSEVASAGWRLPDDGILNELFDTAERSRIANRVIWPTIEIRFGSHGDWARDQLIELCHWFDQLAPVLS